MTQWVHVCLDLPREDIDRGAAFWCSAPNWTLGDPWPDNPEFHTFRAPQGADAYLILQLIEGPPPRICRQALPRPRLSDPAAAAKAGR